MDRGKGCGDNRRMRRPSSAAANYLSRSETRSHDRAVLAVAAGVVLAFCAAVAGQSAFPHGVASGDVSDGAAVCWTRAAMVGPIRFELASESSFARPLRGEMVEPSDERDRTIRVDLGGLEPATRYFYRFVRPESNEASVVGTFVSAPAADDARPFRFVHSGDSNAAARPFRLLGFASDERPEFWFWAGDTAYADASSGGLGVATDRAGYHAKHRQNREDPHLQRLLASAPVWAQWDDHEVGNDYDGGDPEPHLTPQRVAAGQQAFIDYMPLRPAGVAADPRRTYRSFRYGALAEFFILDCRQYRSADAGRAGGGLDPYGFFLPTFDLAAVLRMRDPSRTMLGPEQLAWLTRGLRASTATWKFVVSSVPFTSLLAFPYDRWDGFDAERYDLLRFVDRERIGGLVLLSADIHANVFNPDVTHYLRTTLGQPFSPGFAVPEFISGPIATATLRQEVAGVAAAVLNVPRAEAERSPLVGGGFGVLAGRVALQNGLRFVGADRYAYLVADVAADGVTFTHRGITPDPALESPVLETLHRGRLRPPGCAPGLPVLLLPMALTLSWSSRGARPGCASRMRRGSHPAAGR